MQNNIREFLTGIGFGKNEAEVYASLIEIGEAASVLEISKKTKIHRSNIYDALRTLVQEGLVFEINKETKLFEARPPRSLLNYLQRRQLELNEIVTDFESRLSTKKHSELAKVSKGVFALREAVKSLIDNDEPIDLFGIPGKAPEIIGPMLKDFHKERIQKKINMRHIYNMSAIERVKWLNKLNYTEARILPAKYDSNVTTIVTGDKVIIFLWDNEISVVEMIDSDIAQTYKNYFELIWQKAKSPEEGNGNKNGEKVKVSEKVKIAPKSK